MKKLTTGLVAVSLVAWAATATLLAEDRPTSAPSTAEAGFAAIRKAAAAHDDADEVAWVELSRLDELDLIDGLADFLRDHDIIDSSR